jgi:MFS family permease
VRFTLFAGAAVDSIYWMILGGILVHGICYDFFFVTGQIYIDKKTTPNIRGQVQGLLVLLTQGVGFLLGTQLSGAFVNRIGVDGMLAPADWRLFWGIFAGAALVFAAIFFLLFDDTVDKTTTEDALEPVPPIAI